jgi:hypothetical protein
VSHRGGRSNGWREACVLILILLAAGLAGCLGGDDPPQLDPGPPAEGDGDEEPPRPESPRFPGAPDGEDFPASWSGCESHEARFLIPADMVGELPAGFTPVSGDPAGQTAVIAAQAHSCEGGSVLGRDLSPHAEFRLVVLVEPPPEYSESGVDEYQFLLDGVTSSETMAVQYWIWGFWIEIGEVGFSTVDGVVARVGQVTLDLFGDVELITVVQSAAPDCGDRQVRTFSWDIEYEASYLDSMATDLCRGEGIGKMLLPEPWPTDELPLWLLINTITTGQGFQAWGGFAVEHELVVA